MAGYDYAAERLSAHVEIKDNGAAVVLQYAAPGEVDGGTGTVTPGATVTVNTYGLVSEYTTREIDGSNIMRGDVKLRCSAEDLAKAKQAPTAGWTATLGGVKYRVMHASPVQPGGIAVMWKLQLRK